VFGKLLILLTLAAVAVGVAVRSSSGAAQGRVYVVRPTDTLWSIAARRYGGDPRPGVWRIEQRNGLTASTPLVPGEKLVLP
jgi:LysM repeat protein